MSSNWIVPLVLVSRSVAAARSLTTVAAVPLMVVEDIHLDRLKVSAPIKGGLQDAPRNKDWFDAFVPCAIMHHDGCPVDPGKCRDGCHGKAYSES